MKIFRHNISDENIQQQILAKIFRRNVSDGNISTQLLRRKNYSTKISSIKYLTKLFGWKYFDKIFMTKILSTKYLWRMCYRQNIYDENINEIFVTRILRRNISGGNIVDQIFLTKILLINSAPPPRYHPRAARSPQNLP